ncbi:MAG: hypothetical protein ACRD0G_15825 [Acidimicrobiales bacterium]
MDTEIFELFGEPVTVGTLLIPVFAGAIGYFTNWVAIKMMFLPIEFVGWRLPFKLGFGKYKFPLLGWQGVIPSKAAKMGSIAVDTGLAKLGSMHEFYKELEPEVMAAQILEVSRDQIHATVDEIIQHEYPDLWAAAPDPVKRLVHERVDAQLPQIIAEVMNGIGDNIDRLIDLKLMVIRFLEANPRLINQIFLDVGAKEFRFIVASGAWMGFLLGLGPMLLWIVYPAWWTVPVGAAIVGYLTNYIALKVIFEPVEPTRVAGIRMHGLFLRRQDEVAEAYADIIAFKVVTLKNVADTMIYGPDGDRTKRLIADIVGPVVDDSMGVARPLVQAAAAGRYETIKSELAQRTFAETSTVLLDEEFGRERAKGLQRLLAKRMKELAYPEFAQMLRSAFQQDEWMLISVGAVLGFGAGVIQVFTTL